MTYTDNEMASHISEMQHYLRTISFYNSAIPRIIPDGIFGTETKNAVKAFQREYKLPITGEIDESTWNEIIAEYLVSLEYLSEPLGIQVFPHGGSYLSIGSSGAAVFMLQAMLSALSKIFANIRPTEITGTFNTDNEKTIKFIQTVSGRPPTGKADVYIWNRIVELFNNETADNNS